METVLEILIDILFSILFKWPAAVIRWSFTGFRKPFKEALNDDGDIIGTIGLVVLVGGGLLVFSLFR